MEVGDGQLLLIANVVAASVWAGEDPTLRVRLRRRWRSKHARMPLLLNLSDLLLEPERFLNGEGGLALESVQNRRVRSLFTPVLRQQVRQRDSDDRKRR